jgi:hypothetical protein
VNRAGMLAERRAVELVEYGPSANLCARAHTAASRPRWGHTFTTRRKEDIAKKTLRCQMIVSENHRLG